MMQFSKEAQALAKPCYEAIRGIAERQEKECPRCKGTKTIGIPDKSIAPPAHRIELINCQICNGTGRVKGKWEGVNLVKKR